MPPPRVAVAHGHGGEARSYGSGRSRVAPLPDPGGRSPLVSRACPPVWPRSRTNRTQSRSPAPRAPLIAVAAQDSELRSPLRLSPECTERGKAEPPEPPAPRDSPSSSPPLRVWPRPSLLPPGSHSLPLPGARDSRDPPIPGGAVPRPGATRTPCTPDPLPPSLVPSAPGGSLATQVLPALCEARRHARLWAPASHLAGAP